MLFGELIVVYGEPLLIIIVVVVLLFLVVMFFTHGIGSVAFLGSLMTSLWNGSDKRI